MITKKRKNKRKSLCIIIAVVAFVSVFGIYLIAGIVPPTKVNYSGVQTEYDDDDYRTTASEYTDIKLSDSDISIRKAGAYRISGTLSDGTIYIAADGGVVHLILDGASINCSSGPAIYVSAADKVVITSADGSDNTIKATVSGGLESAIYSDDDLTFNGEGKLNISSEHGIAINCNAGVRFTGGNYSMKAKENVIKAAYSVSVKDGTLTMNSGSDAIKTTTGGRTNGRWIGVVDISGGEVKIVSEKDGINSDSIIYISAGKVDITCGGGSEEITQSNGFGGMGMPPGTSQSNEETVDAKGLKAETGIYITGGDIQLDCSDDAIHSDGDVTVDGARLNILSSNDGIQGDKRVNVLNGEVYIKRCLEGICGRYIILSGGTVDIVAADDGINATNNDNPIAALGTEFEILGTGGRVFINGGTLRIEASSDGLDANGSIEQTGGSVYITSKSNGVEVPIDYTGTYKMTGGILTAFGSGGHMMQGISEQGSTVCSVTVGASFQNGSSVVFKAEDGSELVRETSEYSCTSMIFASEKFTEGMTVTVYVDDIEIGSVVVSGTSVTVGTSNSSPGGMGGRPGNMQGGKMPEGETPPDMQQGGQTPPDIQGGQMQSDMQGGMNNKGGMPGMRGPFGFILPVVMFLVLAGGTILFVVVRKRRKNKTDVSYAEEDDEDDLPE